MNAAIAGLAAISITAADKLSVEELVKDLGMPFSDAVCFLIHLGLMAYEDDVCWDRLFTQLQNEGKVTA